MPLMDPRVFFEGADAVMNMNTQAASNAIARRYHPSAFQTLLTRTKRNVPKDGQDELCGDTGVNPCVDDTARLNDPAHDREEEYEWDVAQDRSTKETFRTHPIDELGEEQELENAVHEAQKAETCANTGWG